MSRKLALLGAMMIWGAMPLVPGTAHAETPLNRAVVASLRNAVQLILRNQSPRPARVKDTMAPGDALTTARAALAELRFNDGSLARIGSQALFRFLPNTRTFQLSNGTLLLLVPPGRGQTRIQTPNAAAGIRGSALFVRYIPATNVTLIGALTESGIEVTNRDRSQKQPLAAGQLAVVVNNRIEQIYRFDLNTFYETSDLVKGLELQRPVSVERSGAETDPSIAAVRAETSEAVAVQVSLERSNTIAAEDNRTLNSNTTRSLSTLQSAGSSVNSETLSNPIALPAASLLTLPTAVSPTNIPPTVALPTTTPLMNLPSAGSTPAAAPPVAGAAPGTPSIGNPPSVIGPTVPGLTLPVGTATGLVGTESPQSGRPPGLAGTAPGLAGTTPGQGGALPPGLSGAAPGLSGATPGRSR